MSNDAHEMQERPPATNGVAQDEDSAKEQHDVTMTSLGNEETLNVGPSNETGFVQLFTLQGHKRSVSSLAISPDGTELVSSGADGLLKIWSLASGALRATLDIGEVLQDGQEQQDEGDASPSHTQQRRTAAMGISDVAWSRDGRYIVCGGDDRTVRVWDAKRHTLLCQFEGHTSFVFCVTFNPDVSLAVSGGFDETVRMWDLQRKTCHRTIAAHSEAVTALDYNRDGSILASCSYDGLIRLWDAFTGQCIKTLVHGDAALPIGHVSFSPNSFQLLATSLDNTIRLWDMANGRVLKTYVGHQNSKFALKASFTAWRQQQKRGHSTRSVHHHTAADIDDTEKDTLPSQPPCMIVSGSEDQRVYLWELQSRRIACTLSGHRDVVLCIATHASVPIIASASLDRDPCIKIWKLQDKQQQQQSSSS